MFVFGGVFAIKYFFDSILENLFFERKPLIFFGGKNPNQHLPGWRLTVCSAAFRRQWPSGRTRPPLLLFRRGLSSPPPAANTPEGDRSPSSRFGEGRSPGRPKENLKKCLSIKDSNNWGKRFSGGVKLHVFLKLINRVSKQHLLTYFCVGPEHKKLFSKSTRYPCVRVCGIAPYCLRVFFSPRLWAKSPLRLHRGHPRRRRREREERS